MGSYQILFLSRIPSSAAVNEAVAMARDLGFAHATSFVNGTLREVARRGRSLLAVDFGLSAAERISQETSHPKWMVERWIEQWGEEETRDLCLANNGVPPLTVRANTLRIVREDLQEALREEGVETEPTVFGPEGLLITNLPVPLGSLKSFQRGEFRIQDEASQLIGHWLDVSSEDLILDACAAPGGKTTHLAQLIGNRGKIIAGDIHAGRLGLLEEECGRLGITNVKTYRLDLSDPEAVPEGPYPRILLDAPCSGLGVLRRNPDAKWRRTPQDIDHMANLQIELLRALISHLSFGGILLYCVCTHTPQETDGVVEKILQEVKGIRLLTSPGGLPHAAKFLVGADGAFRTFPHRHQTDGFTGFRLQRV
jgi:16S rRNA (cytosine967-C5)-methyltransferase